MGVSTISQTDFVGGGEADWRDLSTRGLNGATMEDMKSRAEDGFFYGPLYSRRPDAEPLDVGHDGNWTVIQRVDDTDPQRANVQVLADLEGGATGLSLVFEGSASAHGFGLSREPGALNRALDGAKLQMIHVRIEPNDAGAACADAVFDLVDAIGLSLETLDLDLGLDAVGPAAYGGTFADLDRMAQTAMKFIGSGLRGRAMEADGRVFHDAGATDAQELGAALSSGLFYLRLLNDAGLSVGEAANAIGFTLAVDQRQFEQTAKLRALRLLWAKIIEECGSDDLRPVRLHAQTSWRMMSALDPHSNIIRNTIAAFAAGTGGANSVCVLPHTAPLGLPDRSARRLARNVQLVLIEESHLAQIVDPAAGAGGLEALTGLLAEVGWGEFQKIEAEGGILASLKSGVLQNRILDAAMDRQRRLSAGQTIVVGASIYPLEQEPDARILAVARAAGESRLESGDCERLIPVRTSQGLETSGTRR